MEALSFMAGYVLVIILGMLLLGSFVAGRARRRRNVGHRSRLTVVPSGSYDWTTRPKLITPLDDPFGPTDELIAWAEQRAMPKKPEPDWSKVTVLDNQIEVIPLEPKATGLRLPSVSTPPPAPPPSPSAVVHEVDYWIQTEKMIRELEELRRYLDALKSRLNNTLWPADSLAKAKIEMEHDRLAAKIYMLHKDIDARYDAADMLSMWRGSR